MVYKEEASYALKKMLDMNYGCGSTVYSWDLINSSKISYLGVVGGQSTRQELHGYLRVMVWMLWLSTVICRLIHSISLLKGEMSFLIFSGWFIWVSSRRNPLVFKQEKNVSICLSVFVSIECLLTAYMEATMRYSPLPRYKPETLSFSLPKLRPFIVWACLWGKSR